MSLCGVWSVVWVEQNVFTAFMHWHSVIWDSVMWPMRHATMMYWYVYWYPVLETGSVVFFGGKMNFEQEFKENPAVLSILF